MIQNLIFGILFLKILFLGIQHFYIRPHVPVGIGVFFNFIFFSRKSQSQQKLEKKTFHYSLLKKPHSLNKPQSWSYNTKQE